MVDRFFGIKNFKSLLVLCSSRAFTYFGLETDFCVFWTDWGIFGWDFRRLEARASDFGPISSFSVHHCQFWVDSTHSPCFTASLGSFSFLFLCVFSLYYLPDESPQLPRHKTSTQLSRLSQRHAEVRVLTPPCSIPWKTINGINKILLKDGSFWGKTSTLPNFKTLDLRDYSLW